MKTILNVILVLLVGYLLWSRFTGNTDAKAKEGKPEERNDNREILLKGKVTGIFTFFNQTIYTVKEDDTGKTYHVVLFNGKVSEIDSTVSCKIRKFDLVRINDKDLALYKEIQDAKSD